MAAFQSTIGKDASQLSSEQNRRHGRFSSVVLRRGRTTPLASSGHPSGNRYPSERMYRKGITAPYPAARPSTPRTPTIAQATDRSAGRLRLSRRSHEQQPDPAPAVRPDRLGV